MGQELVNYCHVRPHNVPPVPLNVFPGRNLDKDVVICDFVWIWSDILCLVLSLFLALKRSIVLQESKCPNLLH